MVIEGEKMSKRTHVRGYTRRDGSKVPSHLRELKTRPTSLKYRVPRYYPRIGRANRSMGNLTMNKYFKEIPMYQIEEILKDNHLRIPEESYILTGREGRAQWSIYDTYANKQTNQFLNVSWYRMPSGKYEIVTYIS